jgi:hypothetical protein
MATRSQPPAASTADAFDQSRAGRMRSAVVEAIYRSAFGEDYPPAAACFVSGQESGQRSSQRASKGTGGGCRPSR